MKTFLLFKFAEYDANGGMNDFQGAFDTKDAAIAKMNTFKPAVDNYCGECQIYDVESETTYYYEFFNNSKKWVWTDTI